jgi:hypothetical protein
VVVVVVLVVVSRRKRGEHRRLTIASHSAVCYAPDGESVIVGLESGAVRLSHSLHPSASLTPRAPQSVLLDSATLEIQAVLAPTLPPDSDAPGPQGPAAITALAVSGRGDVLAAGREDGALMMYDLAGRGASDHLPLVSPFAVMRVCLRRRDGG